jgi:hypothetical protein
MLLQNTKLLEPSQLVHFFHIICNHRRWRKYFRNRLACTHTTLPEPLLQDFAILKVSKPRRIKVILPLSSNITYSHRTYYIFRISLGTPVMVSHVGTICGITNDKSLICIQASTNKGNNSGGA